MPREEKERVLVLCVDRDNDIGVKSGIETPLIGRRKNIESASGLALKDPEEADANAMFDAVKTFDTLVKESKGEEYEVATIAGSELGGIKADRNLSSQLEEVLTNFPAKSIVLVTDGFSDEEIIPVIQSHAPIMSIRRVVVRHSEAIEESYALFARYLKKLVEDPHYSRIALGVPGILLISLTFLWIFNLLLYAGYVFLFVVGSVLLIKGFGIDVKIASISVPKPPGLIKLFTQVAAVIIAGMGAYQTYNAVISQIQSQPIMGIMGLIVANATDLAVIAAGTFLIGRGIFYFFTRDARIWRNIVGAVVCVWIREVAFRASLILLSPIPPTSVTDTLVLDLLFSTGLGIAGTVIAVLATMSLSRKYRRFFRGSKAEESGED